MGLRPSRIRTCPNAVKEDPLPNTGMERRWHDEELSGLEMVREKKRR